MLKISVPQLWRFFFEVVWAQGPSVESSLRLEEFEGSTSSKYMSCGKGGLIVGKPLAGCSLFQFFLVGEVIFQQKRSLICFGSFPFP